MSKHYSQRGSVLLYSLLVITLLTAIAITVSIIVVNEIKLSAASANATMAYYAAESGIERGLYEVKINRDSAALTSTLNTIQGFTADHDFVNNADYANDQSDQESSSITNEFIVHNNYTQADYYDVDDPLDTTLPDNTIVKSIEIKNGDTTNPDSSSWAEVSWTAWDDSGTLLASDRARKIIGPSDLEDPGWTINDLDVFDGDPVGYRIRIRALFGDLSSLTVVPYDTFGSQITDQLPSHIRIKSVGERNNFKQSLTATVPWKVPLFGLYDYVLFSEGEIMKTIILSQPVYSSGTIGVEEDNTTAGLCTNCAGGSSCADEGWLATSCSLTASCTIQAAPNPSYCSLPSAVDSFTLPIPDEVSAGPEFYISLREKATSGTSLELNISDPIEGDLGLVHDIPADSDWQTCTIAESFPLSGETGRSIMFSNRSANNIDIDWYQISSYKIFDDCEGS